jgi:hypothetical protein
VSTLDELMQQERPKVFAHVACGCRIKMTLCGKYEPDAVGIEIGEHVAEKVDRWCTECMDLWVSSGCGNCGCHQDALCRFCTAALESATDRPRKGLFEAAVSAAKALLAR